MGLPKRKCDGCRFWDELKNPAMKNKGYCRKGLPQVDPSAQWPTTNSDDWCGQWEDNSSLPVQERKKGDLLSAEEAGAWVGLHPATLRKLACQREITSFKVRGALRFKKEDLEGLIVERPAQKAE